MGMQRVVVKGPKTGQGSIMLQVVNEDGTRNAQATKSPIVLKDEEERELWLGQGQAYLLTSHVGASTEIRAPRVYVPPLVVGKDRQKKRDR